MSPGAEKTSERLSGRRQKVLRQWLGLTLPQFAEMTPESTATHSRREQQNALLTGPTGALVLVLDYLYTLREGAEREQVEPLRQLLATDPTRRHAQEVAIDYHDRPYYGKGTQAEGLWVRGHAKDGTTRFYRVATAYVVLNGLRLTLALRFVLPDDAPRTVLDALLSRVKRLGIGLTCLLLDKGFASIAVMDYLTHQQQPALIACPTRGTAGGTRALCQGRKSYRTTHTFRGAHGTAFTAAVAVCRVFTTARRTHRVPRRAQWLLFSLLHLDLSPRYARQLYRGRFGIETSYRCTAQVRGWTTAKNPAYRFVLLALAFILLNVWVHLRWIFTQVPRRGRRWLDTQRFPLTRFAQFLQRALEHLYGCIQTITAPAMPRC